MGFQELKKEKIIQKEDNYEYKASQTIESIDFKTTVITNNNFDELNEETDNLIPKNVLASNVTVILIVLNNHRYNVADVDYINTSFLDDVQVLEWKELKQLVGGHHVTGLLTFPKADNPKILKFTGLPIEEVLLSFKKVTE